MQNIPSTERVAGEIRAEMARQRKKLNALAGALGISYATLNRRLSEPQAFNLEELEIVANYLGTTLPDFLGRVA